MDLLSRREFLGLAAGFTATPGLLLWWPPAVHIAFIHAADFAVARKAAEMSAAEAQRAADLLRRELHFTALADSAFQRVDPRWTAMIVATRRQLVLPHNQPIVDIATTPRCEPNVFYLRPAQPLAVWHSSLERFGATQLNDRFRAARIRINDQAWLGWFAVKALWEAGVRGKTLREMSFDGHKGRALVFNRDGVLVQPLYELNKAKTEVVAERVPSEAQLKCP